MREGVGGLEGTTACQGGNGSLVRVVAPGDVLWEMCKAEYAACGEATEPSQMRHRLRVQHWMACLETRVVPPAGPNNFYDLLRVGYTHPIPADAELPWVLPRLDLFARFIRGTGSIEFEVPVVWLDAPEGTRTVETFGPLRVAFRRGESVRDVVFRLHNVPIEGAGRHRISLLAVWPLRQQSLKSEFLTLARQP